MRDKLLHLIQPACRAYAHLFINALFPLSLCWSVNSVQMAFDYHHLADILTHLGIALIPLYLWRLIYLISFQQNSKLFLFRNFNHNKISWLGLICATVTLISICRDSYLLYAKNLDIIPAGIIGKYLDYLFQPELLSWSTISFWLVVRYLLIILSFYPYFINLNQLFNRQFFPLANPQIKSNQVNLFPNSCQNSTRGSKSNNPQKKFPHRRRKMYRKKLTYID